MNIRRALVLPGFLVLSLLPLGCAGGSELLGGVMSSLSALKGEASGAKSGLGSLLGSLPNLFRSGAIDPAALQSTLQSATGLEGLLKGLDTKAGSATQALTKYADSLRSDAAKAPTEDGKRAATEKVSALDALLKNLTTQTQATQGAAGGLLAGVKNLTGMLSGTPTQDTLQSAMGMLGKLQTDGQGALASFDGMGKIVDQVTAFLKR